MKIEELLARPEGKTLEFKLDLSSPKNILKTLTAFANSAGGVLLVGIEDCSKAVLGVKHPLDEEERLCNLTADSIEPRLAPSVELVNWKGRTLLAVEVYPSASHPSLVRCAAPSALNHEAHPDPSLTRLSNGCPLGPRVSRPHRFFSMTQIISFSMFWRARRPRSQPAAGQSPLAENSTVGHPLTAGIGITWGRAPKVRHKNRIVYHDEFPGNEQSLKTKLRRSMPNLSCNEEPMPESNPEALDFRVASGLFSGLPAGGLTSGKEREA
jgi:hypothetical protein